MNCPVALRRVQYPVFGFGGRGPDRKVSHCFPLNGNPANPYVNGVDGILQAYRQGLTKYGLSGPTIFSQLIHAASGETHAQIDSRKRMGTGREGRERKG